MPLELSQLNGLLANRQQSVHVGHLPIETRVHMGASHDMVHLSSYSLKHILKKHDDLELFDLLIIPKLLENGLWIGDRPNACCISYLDSFKGIRYIAAIKAADNGKEHYLTTFHKSHKRQTSALVKRGPTLRTHL